MNADQSKDWLADLKKKRSADVDVSTWLRCAVVNLLGAHEKAYLEHCRRHDVDETHNVQSANKPT